MNKKMMALVLAVMMLVCLCLTGCQSQATDARDSVVVVYSVFDDLNYGTISWGHGTGFFVGETGKSAKYILTNYHVIDRFTELGSGELGEYTAVLASGQVLDLTGRSKVRIYFDSNDYEEAFLVAGDASKDIAILKLADNTTKRQPLPLRVPTESVVGKPIQVVGYPGEADNIYADSITAYGKRDATVTTGSVSRLLTTAGKGREDIQVDCKIISGNSGGPVLDSRGNVIGIASWGYDSINYAINISEAIPLLVQYSVPFTTAGGIGSLFNGNLLWIILIAVAVMALVVVVVMIIVLRKKKPRSVSGSVSVDSVPTPRKKPVVRSMARVNAGAMAEVNGKLVIGRSSACGLQFPDDAPGVSGNHCVVEYDASTGDFIVTDIGSSYGTYINGTEKLTPHVPKRLLPRDRFALGDKDNVVIVDLVEV